MKRLISGVDEDAIRRFRREVQLVSDLRHPNVVKVIGRHVKNEPYWYVMPLYDHSLRGILRALVGDENRIKKIFLSVLDAMDYAHGEGVIHRDLKPDNILMNNDSDLVVADFGIGLLAKPGASRQTSSGAHLGTDLYMAPEQRINAKLADKRSDIYSLGRILFELYAGPLQQTAGDLSQLSPEIRFLVKRCTEADPSRRFQTVKDLKQTYLTLFSSPRGGVDLKKFIDLRTQFSVSAKKYKARDVDKFLKLLIKFYALEDDLLFQTMMTLHPDAVEALHRQDPEATNELIREFCDETGRRGWPFSRTDEIANRCLGIFRVVDDPEVRAMITAGLVLMGASHNRWYVMKRAAALIERDKTPVELLALQDRLRPIPEEYLAAVGKHTRLSALEESLLELLRPGAIV